MVANLLKMFILIFITEKIYSAVSKYCSTAD